MTKYSKIKASTFAIVILSLILIAVLSLGGTYAFFSASDSATGTVSTGTLSVDVKSGASETLTFKSGAVVPNENIMDGNITIDYGDTDIKFYVRLFLEVKFNESITQGESEPAPAEAFEIEGLENTSWHVGTGNYYYYHEGENGKICTKSDAPTELNLNIRLKKTVGNGGSDKYMGKTVTITLKVEVIQASYLDSSAEEGSALSIGNLVEKWSSIYDGTYTKPVPGA